MIFLIGLINFSFSIELKSGEEISASSPRHWTYENVKSLTLIPLILPSCETETFEIYTKARYGKWQKREINLCEYSKKRVLTSDDPESSVYISFKGNVKIICFIQIFRLYFDKDFEKK